MKFRVSWVIAVMVFMIGISLTVTATAQSAGVPTPVAGEDVNSVDSPEAQKSFTLYLPVTKLEEPTPPPESDYLKRMVDRVNHHRGNYGCAPLVMHTALTEAAVGHSQDMAVNDFFSHTGSDGSGVVDRVRAAGYSNLYMIGEVIAAGQTTPEAVVDAWMNSDGHWQILMRCDYVHAGPGYYHLANDNGQVNYHRYWTFIVARKY